MLQLFAAALARLRCKAGRREFVVNKDASGGQESFELPAVSYDRKDHAPDDYEYVTDYVLDEQLAEAVECQSESAGECHADCRCNRELDISPEPKLNVVLFRTKTRGWGIRTLEPLKRGAFVGVYSGELITVATSIERRDDTYLFNLCPSQSEPSCANESKLSGQLVCDAKFYGNFTRFINHSCEPNVTGIRTYQNSQFPYIAFFTNQDVPANQELTLNYGDSYWLVKCKRDKVYCLCKTASCRFTRKMFPETLELCERSSS